MWMSLHDIKSHNNKITQYIHNIYNIYRNEKENKGIELILKIINKILNDPNNKRYQNINYKVIKKNYRYVNHILIY